MGWTFTALNGRKITDHIVASYTWESETAKNEVIAHSINVRGGVAYLAVRSTTKATSEVLVWAGVAAIKHIPRAADGYDFGIKEMDETVGPYQCDCPARILDLLTPLPDAPAEGPDPNEYARQWRAACRARIEAKARAKKALCDGATLTLEHALRFNDGVERKTFTVRAGPKIISKGKTRQMWRFQAHDGVFCNLKRRYVASATFG
jgi:hypothetical protein